MNSQVNGSPLVLDDLDLTVFEDADEGKPCCAAEQARASKPEQDDGGQGTGRQEQLGAAVITGSDAAPILEAREHVFNAVALAVEGGIVRDDLLAAPARGDAGGDAPIGQSPAEPIGVIASVRYQRLGLRQQGQERLGTKEITPMASAEKHLYRSPFSIRRDMQLGVQPALSAADQAATLVAGAPL